MRMASRESNAAVLTDRLPLLSTPAMACRLSSNQTSKTSPWQSELPATRAMDRRAGSLSVSFARLDERIPRQVGY